MKTKLEKQMRKLGAASCPIVWEGNEKTSYEFSIIVNQKIYYFISSKKRRKALAALSKSDEVESIIF